MMELPQTAFRGGCGCTPMGEGVAAGKNGTEGGTVIAAGPVEQENRMAGSWGSESIGPGILCFLRESSYPEGCESICWSCR
ncbi:MAG TPA: hypothetical protein GX735_01275 [Firmicutes bacterium]|jgi:hypothetical protein|nr:hypothetical protein [Bacillota bacterium]